MQARNAWINARWIAFMLEERAPHLLCAPYGVDVSPCTEDPRQLALYPRKSLANAGAPRHIISYYYYYYYYPFLLWDRAVLCLEGVTDAILPDCKRPVRYWSLPATNLSARLKR
jgi:hypothetical protein